MLSSYLPNLNITLLPFSSSSSFTFQAEGSELRRGNVSSSSTSCCDGGEGLGFSKQRATRCTFATASQAQAMVEPANPPRRSLRARLSNKRYQNADDPIVIEDDESVSMTASKSGDMSRRTSGASTPATSVSTLTDDVSLEDEKPIVPAESGKTASRLSSAAPVPKEKARKAVESPAARASTGRSTKLEEEPIILYSASPSPKKAEASTRRGRAPLVTPKVEETALNSEDGAAIPKRSLGLSATTKAASYGPATTAGPSFGGKLESKVGPASQATDGQTKGWFYKPDKGKGKQEAQPSADISMSDYALDSEDEDKAIKRSLTAFKRDAQQISDIGKPAHTLSSNGKVKSIPKTKFGRASKDVGPSLGDLETEDESDSGDSDFKPRKKMRSTLVKLAKGGKSEKKESGDTVPNSDPIEDIYDEESEFLSASDFGELESSEEEDDDDASSMDTPLAAAGPSNGAAPGAIGEDQRYETAKQRALRLKREARERRIEANARRTGRVRKKDVRSHYEKSADLLHKHHPELKHVWKKLKALPKREILKAAQPTGLTIKLLPFQLEGLDWLTKQEQSQWKGGILADEMGMGKTIQVISLFLSDRKKPNLVVAPTVAILQWRNEIAKYTEGFEVVVWHGANRSSDANLLKKADVVLVSYGVLESAFRKQVTGFKRKGALIKETSIMHGIEWHRVVLDEAHNIKERATNTAKAAFELKATYRWCLSGTPLQNRVGELYSMIRFLDGDPFSYYYCKRCPCKSLHWQFSDRRSCDKCGHTPMHHTCFWNNEILKPIQRFGTTTGEGRDSFERLRLLLENMMLRRTKLERADDMGLPPRTVEVRRDNFNEEEEDLYESLYSDTTRKFSTFLDQGTILNNYSNIFTLLTRMRQLACHPDLVLRSNTGVAQKLLGDELASVHVCRICQEEAEDAIMSKCRHIFCRECVRQWIGDGERQDGRPPECSYCHMTLTIDLEGDALDPPRQNDHHGARQGILSRLNMNQWRSSTKIEALVEELTQLRSDDKTIKSLVFSQFVNFLDLIAFRLTRAGFNICRLEGNMTPEARNKTIEHFMNNPGVTVFLVSLKAGGVALNLTEASRVFLMDPWWNPSVEVQAMDRIHRLGQHRPIIVKRMVIENSIESRIIELQNKKSAMIEAAIGKDDSAMGRLSVADLSFLFSL